jgi:hypothetical protein
MDSTKTLADLEPTVVRKWRLNAPEPGFAIGAPSEEKGRILARSPPIAELPEPISGECIGLREVSPKSIELVDVEGSKVPATQAGRDRIAPSECVRDFGRMALVRVLKDGLSSVEVRLWNCRSVAQAC